jgi:predicted AlkP superfamily pyrophosphatase or phosphodiesterase
MQKPVSFLAALFLCLVATAAQGATNSSHVVLVVWDGMRPDFVNETNTPNLAKLARDGVTFAKHHPVYISSTEVNGAALATGVYPAQSGIIGNKEYRPRIDPASNIMTASLEAMRRGDQVMKGHFLATATVAEILHKQGLHTAFAGAKTVTLLDDRHADSMAELTANVFEGNVLPASLTKTLRNVLGDFPAVTLPKRGRDLWTTKALIGPLWEKELPAFSVLWLSEPDYSQHKTGPGSPISLDAIRSSDENLGRVLTALDQRGWRDHADVLVVSDHAFSTIAHGIDMAKTLSEAGFHAVREFPKSGAKTGDIMVVGNGGTVFLYVIGQSHFLIEKAVRRLQGESFCGVIFTREPIEGAFRLKDAMLDSPDAPDIVVSLRWTPEANEHGVPGKIDSDYSEYGPGQGMHASLSAFDMHNICFASGPHFRKGYHDELPTGNIDIAPTILALLNVSPAKPMSGRILTEAFLNSSPPPPAPQTQRLEASYQGTHFTWHQYLEESIVNGVVYFNEGNGRQEPLKDVGGR